jgi:hypothetical protein
MTHAFVRFQSSLEGPSFNFRFRAIECCNERKGQLGLSHVGICDSSIDLASIFFSERGRPAASIIVSGVPPDTRGAQIGLRNLSRKFTRHHEGVGQRILRSHRCGAIVRLFFFRSFLCFCELRTAFVS